MEFKEKIFISIRTVAFILILLFLYTRLAYISRQPIAHTTGNLSGFYALEHNSLDVCFVGTSGTFSAFAPMDAWREYGFASYNFCINVMGADTMKYAVREVRKTQKKAVIVIDIYPFVIHHLMRKRTGMEEYAVRYNTDGYKYSLNRLALLWNHLPDDVNKISYYFDLLKYHGDTINLSRINFSSHSVIKGYNNLPWGNASPAIMTDDVKKLEDDFDEALNELVEYCKSIRSKVKILFLYYPYGNVREDSLEYVNYIQQRISKDFPFLNCEDFVDAFDFDYSLDFWNDAHWNIFGAEKITKVIGSRLKDMYGFSDKRKDKRYAKWNADLTEWNNYVAYSKSEILRQKNEAE